jgi:cytochrome c-type biogenesis protein CcmH
MRIVLLALLLARSAPAAGPAADAGLSEAPSGPPPTREIARDRAHQLSASLRCPVCQGLSAADSQAESAVAMRTRVEELVRAGYSDDQVRAYFVSRYGEWVLMEPPVAGHWLLWAAPLVALVLGGAWVARRVGRPGAAGVAPTPPTEA